MLAQILKAIQGLFIPRLKVVRVRKNLEADGSAYSAGDILCETDTNGAGTPWIFKNVVRVKGGSGYIVKAQAITEVEDITPRLALQVYTQYPNCELDDNAPAASPITEDTAAFEDEVLLPAMIARGDNSYSVATLGTAGNLPLPFTCQPGSKDLQLIVITVDGITFDATEFLEVVLTVDQY